MSYPTPPTSSFPESPPSEGAIQRPAESKPLVTYALLATSVLVYLLQMASQYLLNMDLPAALGLKVNELIVRGELWRLITPVFLHGSLVHILFNMYALFNFGPFLERHYGQLRFLLLYFLGGFAGNVASFTFSVYPSLGSSTAIFGLLGAQGVFLYQNRALFGSVAQRALGQILTIAVVNLVIGLSPGIDNWGHAGGLVGGTLFAWFAGPLLRVEGFYPSFTIVDGRETREVILAALSVGALFAGLAAAVIYLHLN